MERIGVRAARLRGAIAWPPQGGRAARPVEAAGVSAVVVAASTVLLAFLTPTVPAEAAGVFYLVGVLAVSTLYGLWWGLGTSLASALAFNFFLLPPRHTFGIRDSGDWLALFAFVVTAVVVSNLAARERAVAEQAARRAAEARLGERLATLVADGWRLDVVLPRLGRQAAQALGAADGDIHRGPPAPASRAANVVPLEFQGRRVGELRLIDPPTGTAVSPDAERVARTLAGLILLAEERERRVAEQIDAETLRRSNALTTALVRAVSHDFRSPLAAIAAALDGLDLGRLDDEDRELIGTVREAGARLDRLVTNLLDLSRLESGAAVPRAEWFDVRDLIDAAVAENGAGRTRVALHLDAGLPLVRADAAQLQRVLANLIENALKFSPPDRPVELVARARRAGVVLTVRDHGPGVPAADRARVFEPFYRGKSAARAPGSGLGLAIAHGLATANGAALTLAADVPDGAAFELTIPAPPTAAVRVAT